MVGIFDSGSGGLTVLKAIRAQMPSCDVVYFGDIAHAPYGSKSQDELAGYVAEGLSLLRKRGADRLVSACNTASASLALSLFDAFGMQPQDIIEMVGPTVSYFKDSNQRILLCATPATVKAGIYQNAFRILGKEVSTVAIPDLAGAIEFAEGEERQKKLIEAAFKNIDWSGIDTLILACTHYPLVLPVFQQIVSEQPGGVAGRLEIFDPAVAVADRVRDGKTHFLISKDSEPFRTLVADLFPAAASNIEVVSAK